MSDRPNIVDAVRRFEAGSGAPTGEGARLDALEARVARLEARNDALRDALVSTLRYSAAFARATSAPEEQADSIAQEFREAGEAAIRDLRNLLGTSGRAPEDG